MRLPTGDADLTAGQPGFSATVVGDWDLGSSRTLRAMAGLSRTPIGNDDALQGNLALLLGRSFDARWSGYGELGWLPGLDQADDQAFVGAGIAFLAGSDLQLDLSADFGLTDDSPDAILACGASWRW